MIDPELKSKAIAIAKENPNDFSISLLQKKLKIGYIACNKLMESLEDDGIIMPYDKNKKGREVINK